MAQLQAMSHSAGGAGQRVRDLESVLKEWNDNFGRGGIESSQGVFGIVPMTPSALRVMLVRQREKIKGMEDDLGEYRARVCVCFTFGLGFQNCLLTFSAKTNLLLTLSIYLTPSTFSRHRSENERLCKRCQATSSRHDGHSH